MNERGTSHRKTSDALLGCLLICGECETKMFRSIDNLKKKLVKVEKELSRWYDAYGKGDMDFDEVTKRIKLASKKKKNIEEQIASILKSYNEAKEQHVNAQQLKEIIQNFSLIWNNATHEERKIILNGFIESITVFKEQPPIIKFRIN